MTGSACQQCGRPLRANAPRGLCSACLLRAGLSALRHCTEPAPLPAPDPSARRVGDYELLDEIGHGGMGVVYKARQVSLDRVVALKMVLGGPLAAREQVRRFRAEAQAAARLQHPNIVAIHEVGEHVGQLYYAMDYIEGTDLAKVLSDPRFDPSNYARSARWLKTVAEAVHYAHQQGVLHRDLKPANIIIDPNNQPHITDFGLAKRFAAVDLSPRQSASGPAGEPAPTDGGGGEATGGLTLSGQVLGSPSYLAPEQAEGRREGVGVGSDVYSLGAVLYHLLTGRPPFQGETLSALLRQVLETEPVAPRRLNPSIPRDLETIGLKCLEKEPRRRYTSAHELADELGRFLADEPIRARPTTRTERAWRWCRRNPKLAGALGAVVLSLVLGLVTTTGQMRRAQASEADARHRAYVSDMDLANRALADEDIGRLRELLARYAPSKQSSASESGPRRPDLRGWEWAYLWQQSRSQTNLQLCARSRSIGGLAFTDDARRLIVHERNRHTLVYDLLTRQPIPGWAQTNLSFYMGVCPPKGWVAFSLAPDDLTDGEVRIWDLRDNAIVSRLDFQHDSFGSLAVSPNGRLLAGIAMRAGTVVWDLATGERILRIPNEAPSPGTLMGAVAFDPTGTVLAVGDGATSAVRLFRVPDGRPEAGFKLPEGGVVALAFSPDGHWLAASRLGTNVAVGVWRLPSGSPLELVGQRKSPWALAFDPRSELLVTGDGQMIRVWDLAARTLLTSLTGHTLSVTALAFSPDGQWLASGSSSVGNEGGDVRLWNIAAVKRPLPPSCQVLTHSGLAVFEPDARSFLALANGIVTRFDLETLKPLESLGQFGASNASLAVTGDGRWLAHASSNGLVQIWDRAISRLQASFQPYPDSFPERGTMRLLPQGRLLATRPDSGGHPFHIWDTASGQQPERWRSLNASAPGCCMTVDATRDGRLLATGHYDGRVMLWDHDGEGPTAVFSGHSDIVLEVAFSPDGRWLASAGWDGALRLWDVHQRRPAGTFRGTEAPCYGITFSPDGRRVASGGLAGPLSAVIWDVASQQHLTGLVGPGFFFFFPRFSPDGRTLAVWKYTADVACFWRVPALADIDQAEERSTVGQE